MAPAKDRSQGQGDTYKSTSDDDAEGVVLGVPNDIIAWYKGCPFVKVPYDHVLLLQLEIVHHILAIGMQAYKVYIKKCITKKKKKLVSATEDLIVSFRLQVIPIAYSEGLP